MADSRLIFDEEGLDLSSPVGQLYSRLFQAMVNASNVEAPDFTLNPPLTENGEIDIDTINKELNVFSEVSMKNSAYSTASSIITVIGEGNIGGGGNESGGGTGGSGGYYLLRSGDSMTGMLRALHGFEGGLDGKIIAQTYIDNANESFLKVIGNLSVSKNAYISGTLDISDNGMSLNGSKFLWYADRKMRYSFPELYIKSTVEIEGYLKVGRVYIREHGIFLDDKEFYHNQNSNNAKVDWTMRNSTVYGRLLTYGTVTAGDTAFLLNGFEFGASKNKLMYSDKNEKGKDYIRLQSDLSLASGFGVQFDDKYIIQARGGGSLATVSFSAPGMVMNLGDSDGALATKSIALQSGIYNHSNLFQIISPYGDGNFQNSLSAGCGGSVPIVMRTYYTSDNDCGVLFRKRLRFYSDSGWSLSGDNIETLSLEAPYVRVGGGGYLTENLKTTLAYKKTDSLFRDLSKEWSASLNFDTESEFFVFGKPIESKSFAIKSEKYKTALIENALLFGDGIFLEGLPDGIFHNGNAYFSKSLSSIRFASGFAGYGWAIMENETYGGIEATFDSLTVRKKLRVYEFEVQKISATNGSLWVSDSCSGDKVEEIF